MISSTFRKKKINRQICMLYEIIICKENDYNKQQESEKKNE